MNKRLYVGNIPYNLCTDEGLRELFAGHTVESTHIVMDGDRPRGFCFVEMVDANAAKEAIEQLHDTNFYGRNVTIRLAHDKKQSGDRRPQRNERRPRN